MRNKANQIHIDQFSGRSIVQLLIIEVGLNFVGLEAVETLAIALEF